MESLSAKELADCLVPEGVACPVQKGEPPRAPPPAGEIPSPIPGRKSVTPKAAAAKRPAPTPSPRRLETEVEEAASPRVKKAKTTTPVLVKAPAGALESPPATRAPVSPAPAAAAAPAKKEAAGYCSIM